MEMALYSERETNKKQIKSISNNLHEEQFTICHNNLIAKLSTTKHT